VITPEAKAWLVSLACDKAKEHGYPYELWTTRLLARHAREHGPSAGHQCVANLVQGTVCKILGQEEIKPHKDFSKFARSVLRHIRVTSKHELKEHIMAGIDNVNRYPVIHTWSYKLAEAA
jgi:hypothetical protein